MKALLDMPVSPVLHEVLERFGHTSVHASEIGQGEAADTTLLELARVEGRVVITADLDFPRLLALSLAAGPGVILFRGGNYSDQEMCELLEKVLRLVAPEVMERSICVVDHRRVRVTPLPLTTGGETTR